MSYRRAVSRFDRVNQWLQFSRQWHVIDANQQVCIPLSLLFCFFECLNVNMSTIKWENMLLTNGSVK